MRAPRGLVADVVRFSWVDGPGNRFVVFLQGCALDCVTCHNPHTIPLESVHARSMAVTELVEQIRPLAPYLSGVTVSGGEATVQAPFVRELFAGLAADDELHVLSRFIDSSGACPGAAWELLLPETDGVMLDLKALDPGQHAALTGHDNADVLASLRQVAEAGKLYEVRLLLVPGHNDDDVTLRATAEWLLGLDPVLRVKAIAFRVHGVRAPASQWPEATAADLRRYQETLTDAGVRHLEVV